MFKKKVISTLILSVLPGAGFSADFTEKVNQALK